MKNRLLANFAVFIFALAGGLSISAAQTTDEGPGPSEQPSAPMEIGQQQPGPPQSARPPQWPSQPGQPQAGQPPMGPDDDSGPSGEGPASTDKGVGRISMIHGDVSTRRGDSATWSAAILNQPVVNGDKVSTAADARAEVQLDYANILRLGANAQATVASFTKSYIQIQVGQGLANYSVFGESEAEPEIDTPNVAVHPAHVDGVFRIEVRPDGDSIVIARKGNAQISTPHGIAELKQGEMATIRGSGADAKYKIGPAPERDDWDRWNSERDHMIHEADAWRHTNKYYVGSEDLDANGHWEDAPDYGQVWVPDEPDGWAPYRDGDWTWEPDYGWTWVGFEPWGWAPYHYGRWMWYGGGWAWWPGPVWGPGFYRPFWAPAYVSFFGFGGWWGLGFGWGGWGGFGWLPIGPCDRFYPWWGGYRGHFGVAGVNHLNALSHGGIAPLHAGTEFSNVAHINDPHIGGALSTVPAGKFGAGRVTALSATHDQLTSARMMTGNMPVVPTRASLSASGRPASASTIHNGAAQHFFGTQTTSHPESFQQQKAQLQQSMQQNHFSPVSAGSRGTTTYAESRASDSRATSPGTSAGQAEPAATPASAESRTDSTSQNRIEANSNSDDWKSFTPAKESETTGRSESAAGNTARSASYWNRTAPTSSYSRGSASRSVSASRPQLNMRQPIVQPRSSGSYGGASHGAPGSGGHSSGGGHSGASSGGHSSGGGGGGSHH
ncbi:MAG: DUF6600 domain-containing protein [Candidatus Sulfotelmatobacter sp.]